MIPNTCKFVAYYRVSSGRQGKSGLGLEAQRAAVKTYLNGGDWQIVDEYTEVESGKRSDRPALNKALAAARLSPSIVGRQQGRSPDAIGGLPIASTRGRRRRPLRRPSPD
jgi:DNA invertase Pin-like site-specific DNA recombinase